MEKQLATLRRFTAPAALLMGLFLLVNTANLYSALSLPAKAYVLCGFGFLLGGIFALALSAVPPLTARRLWWLLRIAAVAVVGLTFALGPAEARLPLPLGVLGSVAVVFAVSVWPKPAPP